MLFLSPTINLSEMFFDYNSKTNRYGMSVSYFTYINPDSSEINKYIAFGSRGWISPSGDLFMEGYEDRNHPTSVIHYEFVESLAKKGACSNETVEKMEYENDDKSFFTYPNRYGILVQRGAYYQDNIFLAETYIWGMLNLKRAKPIIEACNKKNPHMQLIPKLIREFDINDDPINEQ